LLLTRYPLDPTGLSNNNRVNNEIHTTTNRQIRAIAPTYGAFFTTSVSVVDATTNATLTKNTDYITTELLQEATLRYGKELCLLILIINPSVSQNIRISYNVLGGAYQNLSQEIQLLYENILNDGRPVNWNDIQNKPYEFPPSLHNHLLADVVGFEPLVTALERIRNAIILSDVPAFEAIIDWTSSQLDFFRQHIINYTNPHRVNLGQLGHTVATMEELVAGVSTTAFITPSILVPYLMSILSRGLYQLTSPVSVVEGASAVFVINTTNVLNGAIVYWSVVDVQTSPLDFVATSGFVAIQSSTATFSVSVRSDTILETDEIFRIQLRKEDAAGEILALSTPVVVINYTPPIFISYDWFTLLLLDTSLISSAITVEPDVYFFAGSLEL